MKFQETKLKGSYLIHLDVFQDERGWLARTFCKKEFASIGHSKEWVQMNHSFTSSRGTIRGMHYQFAEHKEIKIVRCIAGSVYDVIVDLRKGSETFLQYFGVELSAANRTMIYIPEGFAHGFQALTDNAELIYHHSEFYTPGAESGLRYDDPAIGIKWPLPVTSLSERDSKHPLTDNQFTGI